MGLLSNTTSGSKCAIMSTCVGNCQKLSKERTEAYAKVLWTTLRLNFESDDPAETQNYKGMVKVVVPSTRISSARFISHPLTQ